MRRLVAATALALCLLSHCAGQDIAFLKPGSIEVGGFGGFATGLGQTAAGFGGNFAVAAHRNILPYAEYTYFPNLLNRTSSERVDIQGTSTTAMVHRKNSFSDFHGGVHLRLPLASRPQIMPYFSVGVGGLRKNQGEVEIVGRSTLPDPARTDLAVNFGGGLRWYVNQNVGTRIEVKGYKPRSSIDALNDPFIKVTFDCSTSGGIEIGR